MKIATALVVVLLAATPTFAQDAPDALKAFDDFVKAYWDPQAKVFAPAMFWSSAHIFETVLDAEIATGEKRALLDSFYDGFVAQHPDWANDFNDDLGWWALALLRASEVTGETRFREQAVKLFDSIAAFEDSTYGGGIWWKRDGSVPQKGLPISAPWIMSAVRIAKTGGDPSLVAKAKREYAWLESRFVSPDGKVNDHVEGDGAGTVIEWQFTYNYGTWIGASLALYDATGDRAYYDKAVKAAHYAVDHLGKNGVFPDEGDSDGAGFKMILTRYLADLEAHGEKWLGPVLTKNAESAWRNRRADGLMGRDWASAAPAGPIESFAAVSAVDLLFHAKAVPPRPPLERVGLALGSAFRGAIDQVRFAVLRAKTAGITKVLRRLRPASSPRRTPRRAAARPRGSGRSASRASRTRGRSGR